MASARYSILALGLILVIDVMDMAKVPVMPAYHLLQGERKFLAVLKEYKSTMEINLNKINKYLNHMTTIYESPDKDYAEFLNHPLNIYLLGRRLTLDIEDIVQERIVTPTKKLRDEVKKLQETNELPRKDNITYSLEALYDLQAIYGLDSKALAEGYISCKNYSRCPSKKKAEPLSRLDGVLLAVKAVGSVDFPRTLEWSDIAGSEPMRDEHLMCKDGTVEESVKGISQIMGMVQVSVAMSVTQNAGGGPKIPIGPNSTVITMQRLCRGEKLQPIELQRHLKCKHLLPKDAYYLFQPVRVEQLSKEPYIVMLHDIINKQEIETLKILAKTNVARANFVETAKRSVKQLMKPSFDTRVASDGNEVVKGIDHKLQEILEMKLNKKNKMYQVYNYGTNGHDIKVEETPPKSARKQINDVSVKHGTLMLFLSEAKYGGATIFPTTGVTIKPEMGSGLLWWNILPAGVKGQEDLPFHADCPVLYGDKWVATRMI